MGLIDKSALVVEIEKRIALLENNSDGVISMLASGMFVNEYKDLLSFIDTLEVKEVDLEKEINSWIEDNTCNGYCSASIRDTAEHFFELGMQQSKNGNNNVDFDAELKALLKKYKHLSKKEPVECLEFYIDVINNDLDAVMNEMLRSKN